MRIRAKIGTFAALYIRAARLRKPPRVGQMFYVVEDYAGAKPIRVHCTGIKDVGEPLYLLEMM